MMGVHDFLSYYTRQRTHFLLHILNIYEYLFYTLFCPAVCRLSSMKLRYLQTYLALFSKLHHCVHIKMHFICKKNKSNTFIRQIMRPSEGSFKICLSNSVYLIHIIIEYITAIMNFTKLERNIYSKILTWEVGTFDCKLFKYPNFLKR